MPPGEFKEPLIPLVPQGEVHGTLGPRGIVVVLFAPLLEVGTFPYDVSTWNAEVPWQRAMMPIIGWWGGRLVFAVLKESYRLQDLADQIANFDLFDLRSQLGMDVLSPQQRG